MLRQTNKGSPRNTQRPRAQLESVGLGWQSFSVVACLVMALLGPPPLALGQSITITSISPTSWTAGGSSFTLTVIGTGFDSNAVVQWNGAALSMISTSATQLTATVDTSLVTTAGQATVTVVDGTLTSNSVTFTILPPPAITSLSPNSANAGGSGFTLTVNGTNFDNGAVVQWNGGALGTTIVGSTQLSATVGSSLIATAGTATVTVIDNGVPSSNSATFTISPVITSLSPNLAVAGGPVFTLTVNGSGFDSNAVVEWNSTPLSPTPPVSATQLTVQVPASLISAPGTVAVTVVDNGVTSSPATFTVAPAPVISSLSPSSATAGGQAFSMTVNGTGFVSGAVVQWINGSGTTSLSTSVVNATTLTTQVTAALIATAGTATVNVIEGGVTSNNLTFTISPVPTIASLSPNTATAGAAAFAMTVTGTGFASGAVVQWINGSGTTSLSTSVVNATTLTAQVTAALIATAGTAAVNVLQGGVTSNNLTFTISPAPTIASLSPNTATAGAAAFMMTATGTGFASGAVVQWINTSGTTSLSTTVSSATTLTAQVTPALIATAGTATVNVLQGGVASNNLTFTIAPAPTIASLSPNTATAGAAAFAMTVTGTGFASGAVVQWINTSGTTSLSTSVGSATTLTAQVTAALVATAGTATVNVLQGGVTSNNLTFTIAPAPTIASLSPNTATAGAAAFAMTVTGTGFASGAVVQWISGSVTTPLSTTFSSATTLTAQVTAALIATAGTATVNVLQGGVTSNGLTFTIAPPPVITSLSPNTAAAGGAAFTLTVNGTGFVSGAIVQWNSTTLSTTFVGTTELTATVAASLIATPGTASVTVVENGVTSGAATFTVAAEPVITSLNPLAATAGGAAFTLTVNGTGFLSGAAVHWNSTALTTTFVNSTQLTAQVPANLIASPGTASVTVVEDGVTSAAATFTVSAGPVITSLSPNTAIAGGAAFTLTVNGTAFVSGAAVQWNGTALATTFVSTTQLTARVTASLIATAGTATVTVVVNGVTSSGAAFTIAVGPVITSLSPNATTAGGAAFTLTVNGTGFVSGAAVQWNGTALTTTFVSATQLTAQVTASLIATAGTATVTVVVNGVTSSAAAFTIAAGQVISSLSPNSATVGGAAFTLTVNGTGFVSGAAVQWNGTALTTTFVSATQLTAQVAASLIATAGTATVTVLENGVTSNGVTFTIAAGQAITSLSPNSATAGGAAFTLTVNGTGFVSGAVVQWNGTALATTFVSATQLTAAVPESEIGTPGTANITVVIAGVTSPAEPFMIVPGVSLSGLAATTSPTQNTNVGVTLNKPAATQLTGTLTLSFQADPADANTPVGYQDPNMVFVSNGTKTISFTIPQGATAATLGSNGAIQQGTVAGTITVTMTTLLAGTTDVLPQPAPTQSVNVPRLAPVIQPGSVTIVNLSSTGFDVELNAYSTSRDLVNATFVFQAAPGSVLSGQTSFEVPYSTLAPTYFGGSEGLKNGGYFGLTVHFTFNGDTTVISGGSVGVTLSNSVGTSTQETGGTGK